MGCRVGRFKVALDLPKCLACLGSPVVPFDPFSFWVPFLKPNSRKKGTLIIKGLLGNLVVEPPAMSPSKEDNGCVQPIRS